MEIRKFPEQAERVETGPIQFGEDWPGIFIRGDNAGYYGFVLGLVLENPDIIKTDMILKSTLIGLQKDLQSSTI